MSVMLMFAESFLYSLEVAVASRSCDGRQEGRLRSVRVEELEDPRRVDRGGQGQDASLCKFMSCNLQPAMLSSVIVLMKLRSSRIELASDPIENIHSTFNIQLHFIFFSFIADLGKIWPGLRLG